ncbi:FAD-binding oxidoreductase [Pseudomonas sp. GD03860]|uniref:FAD-binding oxidoreductase n=1 Tax=Pseudomonas TaxID=286 RepID=UPI002364A2A7|nr:MULTISPECIES: FAD-binding oxidoreductase [Pseudomonas]MDD2058419.1 FAD-binding oxidoreductase [Pseudomonas putida]MDH0640231.1 FAD-binding oxidoreductase [Pseudomonas sp. GD03860]
MGGLFASDFADLLEPSAILNAEQAAQRSVAPSRPEQALQVRCLLRPSSTEQVSAILKRCHSAGQPVTVLGGMGGGGGFSHANEVAISTERFNAIEHIDTRSSIALVQAGCVLQTLHEQLQPLGFGYGVDYGGRGSATLGGNIATNAGGSQVLRYGMTREQVLGLEVVLADGTVLSSLNRMLKNNAGYDLKQLFIGSEGTLGIVTRAVLRLRPLPISQNTALLALSGFDEVTELLAHCQQNFPGSLTSFEVMWKGFYRGAIQGHVAPLPADQPFYVLVETSGATPERDREHFETIMQQALEHGWAVDAVLASSHDQRNALWEVRERVLWIMTAPSWFVFDISLAPSAMSDYLSTVAQRLADQWAAAELVVFGHIADGNLHAFVRFAEKMPEETYEQLCTLLYSPLTPLGGSMAAEHGVGQSKVTHLHYSRTPEEMSLMYALKCSLDPKNILNPGRVLSAQPLT